MNKEREIPIAKYYFYFILILAVTYILIVGTVYITFWYVASLGISEDFGISIVFLLWGLILAAVVNAFIVLIKKFFDESAGKKSVEQRLKGIEEVLKKIDKKSNNLRK